LPLDLLLVASANPEDYTHRGRIISPLKDRFGTQVRTHYPRRLEEEIRIMEQEAHPLGGAVPVCVPSFLKEVVGSLAATLRQSPSVSQRSGVSVRFSIGALEIIGASALRRALRAREDEAVARAVDLWAVLPSVIGRVEFDALDEGRELEILERALKQALLGVWRARVGREDLTPIVRGFEGGLVLETSDDMSASACLAQLDGAANGVLERVTRRLGFSAPTPGALASSLELCLEGLHLTKRLNKRATAGRGGWAFSSAGSVSP
jgi:magnesium chelatase subunit I